MLHAELSFPNGSNYFKLFMKLLNSSSAGGKSLQICYYTIESISTFLGLATFIADPGCWPHSNWVMVGGCFVFTLQIPKSVVAKSASAAGKSHPCSRLAFTIPLHCSQDAQHSLQSNAAVFTLNLQTNVESEANFSHSVPIKEGLTWHPSCKCPHTHTHTHTWLLMP